MAHLTIRLLGPFHVTLDGEPITNFESNKVRALLACLVIEPNRPRSREALAGLLWPDQPERTARHNLRQALSNLRQAIRDRDADPPFLRITHRTVQFNPDSDYQLDVVRFDALVAASEAHAHSCLETCKPCIQRLEQAIELYRGEFLAGLFVGDSVSFEEWMLLRRERFHRLALDKLYHLANHYERRREYDRARRYARRQVELEPWREEAHQQLMRLLARSGQRSAALAQYERCRRALAEELGVEPGEETKTLYERIRAAGDTSPHNLPVQLTSFVGREEELSQIAERLEDPGCRLLTLVGPGGIGKTRLALQSATEQFGLFLQGVFFVPLAPLSSATFLVSAIADALDFSFAGAKEPQTQLLNYLQGKEMLLVLDSFEHLLEGATLLPEILRRAPEVKIVVTSRERLRLQAEWVFQIGELPFPERFVAGEIQKYSAVRLFLDRARRRDARFSVSVGNSAAIVQICRLVGGVPLGIELAAASVADLSCAQIATQIEDNLDFLETSLRDVPQRHRSARAVFEHSWNLLSAEEQAVFQRLSVFRGGFEAQAAQNVAGASPRILSALADKSLVQKGAGDRYQVHELLRQYAAEGLDRTPAEKESVLDRHCDHYAGFLQEKAKDLKGDQQQAALAAIRIEIENVRLAWQRAVDQVNWDALERAFFGLQRFYDIYSWFQEGLTVFSSAAANLERKLGPAKQLPRRKAIILATFLSRQGWFSFRLGRSQEAKAFLQRALTLLRQVDAWPELGQVCNDLGIITYRLGEYATAKDLYEESLAVARQLEDPWRAAVSLLNLGNVSRATGEYDQARRYLQEGLAIMREQGDPFSTANCLNNLGEVARAQEEYAAAKGYYQESLDIRREVGDRHGVAVSLHNLGLVANALGTYDEAKTFFEESLSIFTELNSRREYAYPLGGLGDVACNEGAYSEALVYYQNALRVSTETQNVTKALDILTNLAQVLAKADEIEQAIEILILVIEHPRSSTKTGNAAQRILSELETGQPEGALDTWRERKRPRSFEEAVGDVLALQL